MMRRSILRFVDWIILSCSRLGVHVPAAQQRAGETVASKSRRRSLSMYFFDVNSCLYLRNVIHAALTLLLISNVSCWLRFFGPNISPFALPIFQCSCHRFLCIFLCQNSCCFHCWEFSSCQGESWVQLSLSLLWIHTSCSESVLWMLQTTPRRQRIASSSSTRVLDRSRKFPFLFLPSLKNFFFLCILQHRVEQQAGHRITLFGTFLDIENFTLRLSVLTPCALCKFFKKQTYPWSTLQDRSASQIEFWEMESNRLHEVHRRCPHFDSPLLAFLLQHSVRRKMIRCLVSFSESRLIFCLILVEHWVQSSIQYCREQLVHRWQWANWAVIAYILDVTFLVDHFYFHFLPFFRCGIVPFYDLIEDLSHHFFRLIVEKSLMSSARMFHFRLETCQL